MAGFGNARRRAFADAPGHRYSPERVQADLDELRRLAAEPVVATLDSSTRPLRVWHPSASSARADKVYARQIHGYRDHTRARTTKTLVILVDDRDGILDSDPELRWFLICDGHGGCVGFDRKADALEHLAHPEEWCPYCQEGKDDDLDPGAEER